MLRLYKLGSKIYVTRRGIAKAYFDLKRMRLVQAPSHFKHGYNIIITDKISASVRPDIKRIEDA